MVKWILIFSCLAIFMGMVSFCFASDMIVTTDKGKAIETIQIPKDGYVIVTIGKTKVRIWDCGKVDKYRWETVIENPEDVFTYVGYGSSTMRLR
jgi:hypothetical protein